MKIREHLTLWCCLAISSMVCAQPQGGAPQDQRGGFFRGYPGQDYREQRMMRGPSSSYQIMPGQSAATPSAIQTRRGSLTGDSSAFMANDSSGQGQSMEGRKTTRDLSDNPTPHSLHTSDSNSGNQNSNKHSTSGFKDFFTKTKGADDSLKPGKDAASRTNQLSHSDQHDTDNKIEHSNLVGNNADVPSSTHATNGSVQRTGSFPSQDRLKSNLPLGFDQPPLTPRQLQGNFGTSLEKMRGAAAAKDYQTLDTTINQVRRQSAELKGRLRKLSYQQQLSVGPIQMMFDQGISTMEEGLGNGKDCQVKMGISTIEEANRQLGELQGQ